MAKIYLHFLLILISAWLMRQNIKEMVLKHESLKKVFIFTIIISIGVGIVGYLYSPFDNIRRIFSAIFLATIYVLIVIDYRIVTIAILSTSLKLKFKKDPIKFVFVTMRVFKDVDNNVNYVELPQMDSDQSCVVSFDCLHELNEFLIKHESFDLETFKKSGLPDIFIQYLINNNVLSKHRDDVSYYLENRKHNLRFIGQRIDSLQRLLDK